MSALRQGLTYLGSALVYAVVAACGGDGDGGEADPNATPMNGSHGDEPRGLDQAPDGGERADRASSRLSPILFQAADGARALSGWYDNERKEECVLRTAADGKQRCLGAGPEALALFGDASCTRRVVSTETVCDAPTTAHVREGERRRAYTLGTTPVAKAYRNNGNGCIVATLPPSLRILPLEAEIPATSFSEVTPSADSATDPEAGLYASGSRLKLQSIVTADGSRQVVGLFDTARNEECHFAVGGDGKWRCLPEPPARVSSFQFSDSGCTQATAPIRETCTARSFVSNTVAFTQCTAGQSRGIDILSVTGATAKRYGKFGAANACIADPIETGYDALTFGAAVSPTAFVEATRAPRAQAAVPPRVE